MINNLFKKYLYDTTVVIRVEDEYGTGPYHSGVLVDGLDVVDSVRNPMPYRDGIDDCTGCIFGFSSWAQLRAWFNLSVRHGLCVAGFRVGEYVVARKHILTGRSQVAFPRDSAQLIKVKEIL